VPGADHLPGSAVAAFDVDVTRSFVVVPSATSHASTHPTTRLQQGIRKPKIYTDGTIRYGLFTALGEPCNH
jgi:hypothetical protein